MIPKIIHYCWINNDEKSFLPESVQDCISTWKKYLPDYEIKEWNINNFDINKNDYVKEAYNAKKYAFVSDYIRLYVLYNYGGIYMDTDVKVLKSFNELLKNKAFMGFESLNRVATCVIGAEKESVVIKEMLDLYNNRNFINHKGEIDLTPNTVIIKPILKKYNIKFNNILQEKNAVTIYPIEYFCPFNPLTEEMNLTNNSYAVHLFSASWISDRDKIWLILYKKYYNSFRKFLFKDVANILAKIFATYNTEGYSGIKERVCKNLIAFISKK